MCQLPCPITYICMIVGLCNGFKTSLIVVCVHEGELKAWMCGCSGDFPECMANLIGLEVLTASLSGLSYQSSKPNSNGDNLPSWLYFDR